MGFLVPAFLAGLAALGIPLLMHLRDRNEETPTRFPSLMFLVRLPIRTSDRRTVTDWPLLLLRALAVGLLAVAFARPFLGRATAAGASGRVRSVVLLLDRSLSMGFAGTWAAAQDSARARLAGLAPDDQVAVVVFDEEAEVAQPWTKDKALARAVVDATAPVARGTRIGAALRVARSALVSAPPGAPEFVLISDLQRSGLSGVAGLALPKGLPIAVAAVAPAVRPNTAIRAVQARRVADGGRVQLQVQAHLVTRDLPAPRAARITLALAGREVGVRTATLPETGELVVTFDAVPAPGTAVEGRVAITPDALPGDDTSRFTLPADDGLALALVLPDDVAREETLYLERALAIGRAPSVRLEMRRVGALDAATLDRTAAVLFWDVAPPGGPAGERLGRWVEAGGGIGVLVGPRLAGRRGALAGVASTAGRADRTPAGAMLGDVRDEHPLFAPFRGAAAALAAPRFFRYARLEPAVGADVLARFDDGAPAILERTSGAGRAVVLATAFDARDGDLPLQPAFLPLARRLALHLAGHEATPLARTTGESWAPRVLRRDPVVAAPDGTLLRPTGAPADAAVILQQVGVYAAYEGRADGVPRARVAVNVPAGESELVPASPSELLLGVGESADSSIRGVSAPTAVELESRQRVWRWFVLGAVLLLVAESVIASQGWRGRARRATLVPPERS